MDIPVEENKLKRPRSFGLSNEAHALIERYAELKGVSNSKVVETLAKHFLPPAIDHEEKKAATEEEAMRGIVT